MNKRIIGRWGEEQAANYLKKRGYKLIDCGYVTRFGEIDLICSKGKIITFVEVKLRKNDAFAKAREFVTNSKQRKIILSASLWLAERNCTLQPRFDVIEVYAPNGTAAPPSEINHIENAFYPR